MTDTKTPEHLHVTRTDRGFVHLPPIAVRWGGMARGGAVRAYESSAASGPHLWLQVVDDNGTKVTVQLAAEDAWRLADQLRWLVEHHCQGDARPEGQR